MSVRKTQNQIIIDAVMAMVVAMIEDDSTDIEMENSVIGMSPAFLLRNDAGERLAWISIHPIHNCPQVWLALTEECGHANAPVQDDLDIETAPQIFSPIFADENQEDGLRGYNVNNDRFYDQVVEAAKYVVRWLIEGRR